MLERTTITDERNISVIVFKIILHLSKVDLVIINRLLKIFYILFFQFLQLFIHQARSFVEPNLKNQIKCYEIFTPQTGVGKIKYSFMNIEIINE